MVRGFRLFPGIQALEVAAVNRSCRVALRQVAIPHALKTAQKLEI